MPNLGGQTRSAAVSALDKLGLKASIKEEYNSIVAAGVVIRQSPESGSEAMPGSSVTIVVSLGPEPVPSSEPEPSSSETEPPPPPSSEDIEPSSSDEAAAP